MVARTEFFSNGAVIDQGERLNLAFSQFKQASQ
jgi:hypothetical protein